MWEQNREILKHYSKMQNVLILLQLVAGAVPRNLSLTFIHHNGLPFWFIFSQIRLTEAQQQKTDIKDMKPEQLEKVAKLEGWHNELKLLEDKKAELAALAT